MIRRTIDLRGPLEMGATLAPLVHGAGDRTIRLRPREAWLALHTDAGPSTLHLLHERPGRVVARAWGPGAEPALDDAPAIIGEEDRPEAFIAHHPPLHELHRCHPGLRLPATRRVLGALVPAIIEQKVTGIEAFRSYAALLRRLGEPAPGPTPGLLLPPTPELLAGLPYHVLHPMGIERRRADVIRRAAGRAAWLRGAADAAELDRRLRALPGIGPWTSAEVRRCVFGDPDAVSVGDFHVPNAVAWMLAREPRATDERMIQLLEPYRGQRGRVQRLIEVGRVTAPRYGPRLAPRSIAAI